MPKIQSFTNHIDFFHNSNLEVRDCIKKFDADLSLKANKSGIKVLRQELENSFMTKDDWAKLNQMFKQVDKLVEQSN